MSSRTISCVEIPNPLHILWSEGVGNAVGNPGYRGLSTLHGALRVVECRFSLEDT
jgi:hypothetical protein